ncbi:MAG: hypothetical protein AAGI28_14115, partial [Pseudomonadota bacterium]
MKREDRIAKSAKIRRLFVLSVFLLVLPVKALATEPVPLSEYGKLPEVERAALSPSGDRTALVTTIEGQRVLITMNKGESSLLSATQVEDMKVCSIEWVDEQRLLLIASTTIDLPAGFATDKYETTIGQIIPVEGTEGGGLIFGNNERYYVGIMGRYGVRTISGEPYGFFGGIELQRNPGRGPRWVFDHGRPNLFKVNLANFEVTKLDRSAFSGASKDWVIDAQGEIAFTLDRNDDSG